MAMNKLNQIERSVIYALRKIGKSFRFIAKELDRSPSTISREFKRNLRPRYGYDPVDAQMKTDQRKKTFRTSYKFKDQELRSTVIELLKQKVSPAQISGRIKSISHESIYRFVYRDKLEGGNLWKNLRHKRRKRKSRFTKVKRPQIKNRIGIEERPQIVESKSRFGDLEIDTMLGRYSKGAILTIVDRYTKFLWAKFIDKHTAENVERAMKELLGEFKIETITSDNGLEFSRHENIAKELGAKFFFANPYSSWQRGLNEHTNGLLRQYYPKRTYFNSKTLENLDEIVREINNRPRKVLNFKTPQEILNSLKTKGILAKNSNLKCCV